MASTLAGGAGAGAASTGSASTGIVPSSSSPSATLLIHGVEVPVKGETPDIDVAKALSSKPMQEWALGMDKELKVTDITIQSLDMFGPRVGFMKFSAAVEFHGKRVPGIVFMRGGAVAILVVLNCEGEKWVVCTRQPRVPIGRSDYLEIPAGMLDDSGHFAGVAAKELREETGIIIQDSELYDLTGIAYGIPAAASSSSTPSSSSPTTPSATTTTAHPVTKAATQPSSAAALLQGPRGMYPSVGGCDEFIRLMYYTKTVTRPELVELQGKATGNIEEGEVITLDLVKYDDLWKSSTDSKTLSAILLYEKLKAAGSIPE